MPTWLVHGFRWPRPLIRIHIILQNLDDAAAEWLMAPATSRVMTQNFKEIYPEQMQSLASLRFIEQHNPNDLTATEQPYAYVCDQVHEIALGVDIDEVRGKGVANEAWAALADLRDKIAPGEKIGWFVVVNGDVERWVPPEQRGMNSTDESQTSPISQNSSYGRLSEQRDAEQVKPESNGLKKWFSGKARKAKSMRDLRASIRNVPLSPPLPNLSRKGSHSALRNGSQNGSRNSSIVLPNRPARPLTSAANGKAPVHQIPMES